MRVVLNYDLLRFIDNFWFVTTSKYYLNILKEESASSNLDNKSANTFISANLFNDISESSHREEHFPLHPVEVTKLSLLIGKEFLH